MSRLFSLVCSALVLLIASLDPSTAHAQDRGEAGGEASDEVVASPTPPATAMVLSDQEQAFRTDAGTLYDVGFGFTLTSIALGALGGGLFAVEGFGGVISGGTIAGLGGLFFLSGVPMWLVGAARADILDAGDRESTAERWEIAGIVTFVTGMLVAAVGAALMGLPGDLLGNDADAIRVTGITMLPVGVAIALFAGLPMWAEGARF